MFEKFLSQDAANFRQRYINTYGFFRNEDKNKLLVKINRIDNTVGFIDKDGLGYTLNPDTPNDIGFEFLPPKSGWHNTTSGAWLVRRTATRQWSRGISSNNTRITTPRGHSANVDFPILSQIYEHSVTMPQALKRFNAHSDRDTGFLAISEQFSVDSKTGMFYCYDTPIGKCLAENDVFKITLDDPDLWHTECVDAFKRAQGLSMEFV